MKKAKRLAGVLVALVALASVRADPPAGPVFCRYVPERADDFAWENDVVAFRAYGPALRRSGGHEGSGVDCWFKRTPRPIIDEWYANDPKGISYHQDHGDGYDGYDVGSSRGCGGTALWRNGKMVAAEVYTAQRIVSQSPDEAVFELEYDYPPDPDEGVVHEVKRITIRAHTHFFISQSTFTKGGQPVVADVAVGLTTHDGKANATLRPEEGWMSCWEVIDGQGVGTGVWTAASQGTEMREVRGQQPDESHAVLIVRTDSRGQERHRAGFAWAGAGEVTTERAWQHLLKFSVEQARAEKAWSDRLQKSPESKWIKIHRAREE